MNFMFLFNVFLCGLNMYFAVRGLKRRDYGFITWLSLGAGLWCGYDVIRMLSMVN